MEDANKQYARLSEAAEYYKQYGFQYIDVPWIIPSDVTQITKPEGATPFNLANGTDLVGSAEQSFIYLVKEKRLPPGQYQSITPCFRDDNVDYWHQKYFTKLELFKNDVVTEAELHNVLFACKSFFDTHLPTRIIKTPEGFDIVSAEGGIELGSYGIREHELIGKWIYATGLAEPRLSKVLHDHQ